jgi:hypothetical protein
LRKAGFEGMSARREKKSTPHKKAGPSWGMQDKEKFLIG